MHDDFRVPVRQHGIDSCRPCRHLEHPQAIDDGAESRRGWVLAVEHGRILSWAAPRTLAPRTTYVYREVTHTSFSRNRYLIGLPTTARRVSRKETVLMRAMWQWRTWVAMAVLLAVTL